MSNGDGAASATSAAAEDGGGITIDGIGGKNDATQATNSSSSSLHSMKLVPVPPPPGLGATERELEYFLRDALSSCIMLERYPRCVIQVVIQIVQADGAVLGSAVNCAALALMDAGVAMRGMPVASTCAVIRNSRGTEMGNDDMDETDGGGGGPTVWLDPTAEEESGEGHAIAVHVTNMTSSSSSEGGGSDAGEITSSFTFGSPLSLEGLLASMDRTMQSRAAMVAFMRLAVEQKVQREVQTLWS